MVHLLMIIHSAISAGTFLVAKRALGELSALELALVRFTLAASVYALLLWKERVRIARRDLVRLAALGFMAIPLNQGLFLVGLARTTSGHGALLYALTPIFVFLIARARLGERATPLKLVGIAVAFVGVLVVLLPRGAASVSGAGSPLVGDLLILAAVVAYAVFATGGSRSRSAMDPWCPPASSPSPARCSTCRLASPARTSGTWRRSRRRDGWPSRTSSSPPAWRPTSSTTRCSRAERAASRSGRTYSRS